MQNTFFKNKVIKKSVYFLCDCGICRKNRDQLFPRSPLGSWIKFRSHGGLCELYISLISKCMNWLVCSLMWNTFLKQSLTNSVLHWYHKVYFFCGTWIWFRSRLDVPTIRLLNQFQEPRPLRAVCFFNFEKYELICVLSHAKHIFEIKFIEFCFYSGIKKYISSVAPGFTSGANLCTYDVVRTVDKFRV